MKKLSILDAFQVVVACSLKPKDLIFILVADVPLKNTCASFLFQTNFCLSGI